MTEAKAKVRGTRCQIHVAPIKSPRVEAGKGNLYRGKKAGGEDLWSEVFSVRDADGSFFFLFFKL